MHKIECTLWLYVNEVLIQAKLFYGVRNQSSE